VAQPVFYLSKDLSPEKPIEITARRGSVIHTLRRTFSYQIKDNGTGGACDRVTSLEKLSNIYTQLDNLRGRRPLWRLPVPGRIVKIDTK
jgi:hypothetical protein